MSEEIKIEKDPTTDEGVVEQVVPAETGLPKEDGIDEPSPPKKHTPYRRIPTGAKKPIMSRERTKQLRERARKTARQAIVQVRVQFTVSEELYEILLDLAETFRYRVNDVARQCMLDGMHKYAAFRSPWDFANPMRPVEGYVDDDGRGGQRGIINRMPEILDEEKGLGATHRQAADEDSTAFVRAVRAQGDHMLPPSAGEPAEGTSRRSKGPPIDYGVEKPLKAFDAQPRLSEIKLDEKT